MLVQSELLKGKIALVTGSSGGLGKTFAEGLAMAGATVILNGTNREKATKIYHEFKEKGYDVTLSVFDVTSSKEINKAAEELVHKHGTLDILVNNAGVQHRQAIEEFPEEEWDRVINTNLKALFLVSKAFVKRMIARQSGKIINIGSLQSKLGRATVSPYAASKGGVKMLTRSMAAEWAKHNIQVNGIGPGYFKTELTKVLYEDEEFDTWLKARTPANRWGQPEELVGTLLFLASDASDFVNGQMIFVDGGITASI
jgi:gluconate 5-dehydrogenase